MRRLFSAVCVFDIVRALFNFGEGEHCASLRVRPFFSDQRFDSFQRKPGDVRRESFHIRRLERLVPDPPDISGRASGNTHHCPKMLRAHSRTSLAEPAAPKFRTICGAVHSSAGMADSTNSSRALVVRPFPAQQFPMPSRSALVRESAAERTG